MFLVQQTGPYGEWPQADANTTWSVQAVQAKQRRVTPAASGEGGGARIEGRPLLPWRRPMGACFDSEDRAATNFLR